MAVPVSRRRLRPSKKSQRHELCFCGSLCFIVFARIPLMVLFFILIFLWSSSTTIISGNIVHVCVSSRKLNNHYCLSAGTQPNFEIPIPVINNASLRSGAGSDSEVVGLAPASNLTTIKEVDNGVRPGAIKEVVDVVSASNDGEIKNFVNVVLDDQVIRNEKVANAKKAVEVQMQLHRSWFSEGNFRTCDGRGIFVYDLPTKFNKDLVGQCGDMLPWTDICKSLRNEALGEPIENLGKGWYHTHQYSLEPIFHSRILKHPCRVYNENEAKLFYVPYYGGLDILRWHFKNVSNDVKDTLSLDLLKWLGSKKSWIQNSGRDHVFVLGKISWDFRRRDDSPWGTRFLKLEQMQNPVKLLIERQPWEVNEIGIPHPTYYHPNSDEDIISWQIKIIQANRNHLVSFAGGARPNQAGSIRTTLINQCTMNDNCQFLNCSQGRCNQPESVINLQTESEFCLQPPGDSPTRKSVFDSLISGCIPVLFDPFTAYYQYPWHLPEEHSKYSVFIDQEAVRQMKVNVVERLMNVSVRERQDLRRYIVYELLPGLVYGDSNSQFNKFHDAFSVTVNNLLERVNRL